MEKSSHKLETELADLRLRLLEAEETLEAIRNNEVDALVVEGPSGDQVYTLQGAEQPYRVLVETMSEGAATMTPDGTVLYSNGQLAIMLKSPLNEILGRSFHGFIVSGATQTFESMLLSCDRAGRRGEFLLKTSGAEEIPVLLSVRPLVHDGMEAFCIVATDLTDQKRVQQELEDARMHLEERVAERTALLSLANARLQTEITDRKRAEEELRESEGRFRSVLDGSRDVIYRLSVRTGRFEYISPSCEKVVGFSAEELLTMDAETALTMIHPGDRKVMRVALARLEETGETEVEYRQKVKGGSYRWLSNRMALTRDITGAALYREGSIRDITDHRRAAEALHKAYDEMEQRVEERTAELRESEETARRALAEIENYYDTAPAGLVVLDADLRYVRINERLAALNGVPAVEHIGRTPREIVPWLADELERLARQIFESGEPVTGVEFKSATPAQPDIQRTWVEDWYPLKDTAGRVVGITAVVQEVTGQRRLENQLHQAQKMEAMGTLSGGIAHDFNNILAAIIGFAEVARDKTPPEWPTRRYLERILTAGLRGRELVKQILTFSRQTAQEKQPLRLSTVVEESVKLLRASLPTTINIVVSVEKGSGYVFADPTQMQQVVLNLCTNSGYAMRQSGGRLTINVSDFSVASPLNAPDPAMTPGPYMRLEVTDTGEGIPFDIVQKIFDPFFTTKPQGEGTGLGLSVVHGIVAGHGGAMTVSSKPDNGSTFVVYLPKYRQGRPSVTLHGEEAVPGGHERILFLDDEEALAEMGDEMLSELGYQVVSRTNAREALALIRLDPSRFDLIITDQTMPGMTGVDLATEILTLRPGMPIILCTGFSNLVDANTARAAGIKAFVMKPLTKKEIARTIRQVLDE
jgi:PAS domain S-box-containing protein